MRRENRKDDAVSPVIGVMLMLVVTIVIAAVVVMFSTGLTGDTKTTPTAMFEVSGMDTFSGPYGEELIYLNIRHKGGDAIPLSDLKINLEQVGGENSGMIRTYTASDSLTNMDTSYAEWSVADPNDVNYYKSAKETLETKQPEIDAALSAASLDPAVYGNFYADDNYMSFMQQNGLMPYMDMMLISEMNLAARTVKEIEDRYGGPENMVFDTDGKTLLGGLMGERMTYPVTVLGQTQPTKSTVSTGNIIHIVPVTGHVGDVIPAGCSVKWTISYIPTNSIIAKGEFDVIAD